MSDNTIDLAGKIVDLPLLHTELVSAAIAVAGLMVSGDELTMLDAESAAIPPTPQAEAVVEAHVAPPRVVEFAGRAQVEALTRTTDAAPLEVFRFPCEMRHLYEASLTISGVDAGNFASKIMEGRFTWKRITGNAIVVGVTVVSDIHDTAAASWAPNFGPSGTEIVFTVQGAAGRTIDWLLLGSVGTYAPGGLG